MNRRIANSLQLARPLLSAVAAGVVVAVVGMSLASAQQGNQGDSGQGVGLSAEHEELTLFEFVGHIDQDGNDLVAYGYLTHVSGMSDAALFTGQPFNEGSARYTFVTQGSLDRRFIVGSVFNLVSNDSSTKYYYRPLGGGGCVGIPAPSCPADPAPFAVGTPFAESSGRDSFVNAVIAPGIGLASGSAAVMLRAISFKAAGTPPFPLWKPGTGVRITYFGESRLIDPVVPKSFSLIAGRGTVLH